MTVHLKKKVERAEGVPIPHEGWSRARVAIPEWFAAALDRPDSEIDPISESRGAQSGRLLVRTPSGVVLALPGDWIVRGADGTIRVLPRHVIDEQWEYEPFVPEPISGSSSSPDPMPGEDTFSDDFSRVVMPAWCGHLDRTLNGVGDRGKTIGWLQPVYQPYGGAQFQKRATGAFDLQVGGAGEGWRTLLVAGALYRVIIERVDPDKEAS